MKTELIGWEVVVMRRGMKAPSKLSPLFTVKSAAEECLRLLVASIEPKAYLREVRRAPGSSIVVSSPRAPRP